MKKAYNPYKKRNREIMNSRERVLTTFNFQEADRVPLFKLLIKTEIMK